MACPSWQGGLLRYASLRRAAKTDTPTRPRASLRSALHRCGALGLRHHFGARSPTGSRQAIHKPTKTITPTGSRQALHISEPKAHQTSPPKERQSRKEFRVATARGRASCGRPPRRLPTVAASASLRRWAAGVVTAAALAPGAAAPLHYARASKYVLGSPA